MSTFTAARRENTETFYSPPGALIMLGFAGLVLDTVWHTNDGLEETGWTVDEGW